MFLVEPVPLDPLATGIKDDNFDILDQLLRRVDFDLFKSNLAIHPSIVTDFGTVSFDAFGNVAVENASVPFLST